MDLTWLALSVGAIAMSVVAYLAWHIGKQDAGTPQPNIFADYEIGDKTSRKRERRAVRIELLIEKGCPRGFFVP
jgi:hypothetical protein